MGVVEESKRGEASVRGGAMAELLPTVERAVRLIVGAGSPHAEDAVQEALMAIDRDLRQVRDRDAARAWAHRVATRCAVRLARRERRRALVGLASPPPPRDVEGIDSTLGSIIEAFDRLPPRMRAVAVLRLYVGLSEQETADAIGCAPGTVKSQLFEARKRLAAELARRGEAVKTELIDEQLLRRALVAYEDVRAPAQPAARHRVRPLRLGAVLAVVALVVVGSAVAAQRVVLQPLGVFGLDPRYGPLRDRDFIVSINANGVSPKVTHAGLVLRRQEAGGEVRVYATTNVDGVMESASARTAILRASAVARARPIWPHRCT